MTPVFGAFVKVAPSKPTNSTDARARTLQDDFRSPVNDGVGTP